MPNFERSYAEVQAKLPRSSNEVESKFEQSCVKVRVNFFCEVRFEVETSFPCLPYAVRVLAAASLVVNNTPMPLLPPYALLPCQILYLQELCQP